MHIYYTSIQDSGYNLIFLLLTLECRKLKLSKIFVIKLLFGLSIILASGITCKLKLIIFFPKNACTKRKNVV